MDYLHYYFGLEPPCVMEVTGLSVTGFNLDAIDVSYSRVLAQAGPEILATFGEFGRTGFSSIALKDGQVAGFCLVAQRHELDPEILSLFGEEPAIERSVLQSSLHKLWRHEQTRVTALDLPLPNSLLEAGFADCSGRGNFELFMGLMSQGRFEEAESLYSREEPENVQFQRMLKSSRDKLFWSDLRGLPGFLETEDVIGLSRRHILACAPLLFESFGEDSSWLTGFIPEALEKSCVGLVEGGRMVGACLVSCASVPAIAAITVSRDSRGKGWGSRLLAHSLERLRALGYRTAIAQVREANLASIALFSKLGFRIVDGVEELLNLGKQVGRVDPAWFRYIPDEQRATVENNCRKAGIDISGS